MSQAIDTSGEDWRRICEARTYLRRGISTPARVDALIDEVARHRGAAAAEQLREEMRRQWPTRREWMGAGP